MLRPHDARGAVQLGMLVGAGYDAEGGPSPESWEPSPSASEIQELREATRAVPPTAIASECSRLATTRTTPARNAAIDELGLMTTIGRGAPPGGVRASSAPAFN